MTNPNDSGKIYYTTDGTDPRESPARNPVGAQYAGPIMLTESTHVKARVLAGREWSALNEAVFIVGPVTDDLRITEIMYNPASGNQDQEYIELLNIGSVPVTLAEYDSEHFVHVPWRLTDSGGISFDFPLGITVAPGECLLVVKDMNAFSSAYPNVGGVHIFEWGSGKLDNGGEEVQLWKPGEKVEGIRHYIRVDWVSYSDGSHPPGQDRWPSEPDGGGMSLTRKVPSDYGDDPANWIAAVPSPGR
jgi:hypothetical protein